MKQKTVNDMYGYSKDKGLFLLSNYDKPFWSDYINNHEKYDALFRRMFFSFKYYVQDYDETIESITNNFINDVYTHLLVNDKKYSELYRVNILSDEKYSITDNYDVTEIMQRNNIKNDTTTLGSRTDVTNNVVDEKTDIVVDEIGSRIDTNETKTGEQSSTNTNTIAGFNSSDFENDKQEKMTIGDRTDAINNTTGEQTNKTTTTLGGQKNTNNFAKGEQIDKYESSEDDNYTLTRKGNIGVQTASDIITKHIDLWTPWSFYTMIFKDICSELLLV